MVNQPALGKKINEIEDSIWSVVRSLVEYGPISAKLISDQPAYAAVANLVNVFVTGRKNPKILDFGCHIGTSTSILARGNPNAQVVGVDNNPLVLTEAEMSRVDHNISFLKVETSEPLVENYFDVAVLTFLHPTLKTREDLESIIRKVSKSLKMGGKIIMLGLNPDGFPTPDSPKNYISYNHSLVNGIYEDGMPFKNSLNLDGNVVEFEDTCWTKETLEEVLNNNSFEAEIYPLTPEGLPNRMPFLLAASIHQVEKAHPGIVWGDEWTEPGLFQIIIGTKVE